MVTCPMYVYINILANVCEGFHSFIQILTFFIFVLSFTSSFHSRYISFEYLVDLELNDVQTVSLQQMQLLLGFSQVETHA